MGVQQDSRRIINRREVAVNMDAPPQNEKMKRAEGKTPWGKVSCPKQCLIEETNSPLVKNE